MMQNKFTQPIFTRDGPDTLRLYDRPAIPSQTDFAKSVESAARSLEERDRPIAINLINDHRISASRATHFFGFVATHYGSKLSPQELSDALRQYRRDFISVNPSGSYDEGPASSNWVTNTVDLVHVCNVTTKLIRISNNQKAQGFAPSAFQAMGLGKRSFSDPAAVYRAVRPRLTTQAGRDSFVESFLDLLNLYRTVSPNHPTWATARSDFDGINASDAPACWLESVGIPSAPEEIILTLRYESSVTLNLYRPTQFEAGGFSYHFPSPPCAPLQNGGHPMNIQSDTPKPLFSEYIHSEIDFNLNHWKAAGSWLAVTGAHGTPDLLMNYRRRHYRVLCDSYNDTSIASWMPNGTRLDR